MRSASGPTLYSARKSSRSPDRGSRSGSMWRSRDPTIDPLGLGGERRIVPPPGQLHEELGNTAPGQAIDDGAFRVLIRERPREVRIRRSEVWRRVQPGRLTHSPPFRSCPSNSSPEDTPTIPEHPQARPQNRVNALGRHFCLVYFAEQSHDPAASYRIDHAGFTWPGRER